ncbi:MAG TPA: hypothetical protein VMF55_08050 [Solirubrobacterales bacterium]|nr:hypothetical protein [Solirubrobacterales bacterium]
MSAAAVLVLGAAEAPSAAAASPWWHLTSGSRPTYVDPDAGEPGTDQVQELRVTNQEVLGGAEQTYFKLSVGSSFEEFFSTEPLGSIFGGTELSAANLRSALEGAYGGPVTVTPNPVPGEFVYEIITPPGPHLEAIGGLIFTAEATVIDPGRPEKPDGTIVVFAENFGNAPVKGATSPVTFTDTLPPGLIPTSVTAVRNASASFFLPLNCEPLPQISCRLEADLPPYQALELRIGVNVAPGAQTGEPNTVSISGGTAATATLRRPVTISREPVPFGLEDYELRIEEEGGELTGGAASHPFQVTGTVALNQGVQEERGGKPYVQPSFLPKDIDTELPPGFIGNPSPFAVCTLVQFSHVYSGGGPRGNVEENDCPDSSVVGAATVTVEEPTAAGYLTLVTPVYNLEPAFGEPARFGFALPVAHTQVTLDTALRDGPGEDYGVTIHADNVSQQAGPLLAQVTFWGVPGSAAHDASRGWSCLGESQGYAHGLCVPAGESNPPALLTVPTSCSGPLQTSVLAASWDQPGIFGRFLPPAPLQSLGACNQVPFAPTIAAEPTSDSATSPTGLKFDLNFKNEGLTNSNAGARAEANLKKAVVTLPEGFTANPSVAEGLKACSQAEYESATVEPGTGCLSESKIGDVEIESPLVASRTEKVVKGGLFVARQHDNPYGNLLTLYMIARAPELGVVIRQALKVEPNPVTGQLTTTVDDVPQLPFSHFHLEFRTGQRAPLITPPACGTYAVKAELYPYSNPEVAREEESSFKITAGPEGQGCPSGGTPPFHPTLEAGTTNNSAGTYSPFYTRISRKDSEQEITHFSIKLPPGVSGKLKGLEQCSDAQIAAAKAREHELGGQEEIEHPSCPASSEIGHTTVGTGVGNVLAYAPGKLYLAGPYKGSNLSVVSITAAKVGPFDLGTVVIREGLKVDPTTAQVSVDAAGSDPIPHIVDGIPVHLRDIRIYVDRPQFVINPTSCARTETASTVLGSGTNFASEADDQPVTVTSPFQAASCASLGFKPKLALSLSGPTKRAGLPKLKAVVTYPKGGAYANIARTVVTLPPSELLEQGHIGSSCTRVQYNAGGGHGEQCPKNSLLGHAKAITPLLGEPLEGNVYLRSNGGERKLPDLVAALKSKDIDIDLVGFIDSRHKKGSEISQIRNTFAAVPDAPVEKFTLELFGGKKGLLVNTTNLCKGTHKAISEFTGQNGKLYDTEPVVKAQCGKKGKGKKAKSGSKKKGH